MSPSSAVYGDQYDPKYVTFEQILQAVFKVDTIWVFHSSSLNQLVYFHFFPPSSKAPTWKAKTCLKRAYLFKTYAFKNALDVP